MSTPKRPRKLSFSDELSSASTSKQSDYNYFDTEHSIPVDENSIPVDKSSIPVQENSIHDDEDSTSDEEMDRINNLQDRLCHLKEEYYDRKREIAVIERCIEVRKVSSYVDNLLSNTKDDSISVHEKKTLKELFEKNNTLCNKLKDITKINKNTMKEIVQLYVDVQALMEERKKIWDEAVKIHKLKLGDESAFLKFDELDPFDASNVIQKEKDYLIRGFDCAVVAKYFRMIKVAKILYNLICNSEVPWSTDENLLEIIECTSKMFDRDFDINNHKEFIKIVDEITHRLNKVKI